MEDPIITEHRAACDKLVATAEAVLASVIAPPDPAGPSPVVGSGGGLAEAERRLDAAKAAHAENTINLHMAEDAYEASLSRLNRAKQEYEDAVESASANSRS